MDADLQEDGVGNRSGASPVSYLGELVLSFSPHLCSSLPPFFSFFPHSLFFLSFVLLADIISSACQVQQGAWGRGLIPAVIQGPRLTDPSSALQLMALEAIVGVTFQGAEGKDGR